MKNLFIIGLSSAALLSAPTLTSAQVNPVPPQNESKPPAPVQTESKTPPPAAQSDRAGPTDNQIADDVDARIARLKADLRLTPDQENNWGGLQTAFHDYGIGEFKKMLAGRSTHRADQSREERPNDIAMMRDEADALNDKAASLKKLADAAEPIYGSLDDRQRHKLMQFLKAEIEHR